MGYLVYVRPDNVMAAAPFDPRSGRVTGAHVEIANDVLPEEFEHQRLEEATAWTSRSTPHGGSRTMPPPKRIAPRFSDH
jgi:hypothetical protein